MQKIKCNIGTHYRPKPTTGKILQAEGYNLTKKQALPKQVHISNRRILKTNKTPQPCCNINVKQNTE